MTTPNLTKKQLAAFEKETADAKALILKLGGKALGERSWHQYTVPTACGEMGVSFNAGSCLFSIFCRFDDVKRASAYLKEHCLRACNPYSGKWNFHETDAASIVTDFISQLSLIQEVRS